MPVYRSRYRHTKVGPPTTYPVSVKLAEGKTYHPRIVSSRFELWDISAAFTHQQQTYRRMRGEKVRGRCLLCLLHAAPSSKVLVSELITPYKLLTAQWQPADDSNFGTSSLHR